MITPDLSQGLLVIGLISMACIVLAPILWWILPNRATSG